jgi:hypothetical protein
MHQFDDFSDAELANAAQFVAGKKEESYDASLSGVASASKDLNTLLEDRCP